MVSHISHIIVKLDIVALICHNNQLNSDTSTKPDGAFGAKSFRFVFDTPGTKVNRKIEVTAKGNYQGRGNNEVEISVTSPFLNAKLLGNKIRSRSI